MGQSRLYKTEAVVLRQVRLGEADKILTLYTPYLGKVRAVAKGICRPKSKLAGHLEPLSHSLLLLARGQNLDIITQAQSIESYMALRQDLWLTSWGLYIAELADRFSAEHLENYPLFRLLTSALRCLSQEREPVLLLRSFEVHLLDLAGYRPQLIKCSLCACSLKPETNYFSPSAGGVVCPLCRQKGLSVYLLSPNALKVLRLLQTESFPPSSKLKLGEGLSTELEQLLRHYIRYFAEQDIKSTRWLDTLKKEDRSNRERPLTPV